MADGNYEVGFGKPPKHSRFSKGQSGNPGGRRRREETMAETLERLLSETIHVNRRGKRKRVTTAEAVLSSTVLLSMKGDARARRDLLNLSRQAGLLEPVSRPEAAAHEVIRFTLAVDPDSPPHQPWRLRERAEENDDL